MEFKKNYLYKNTVIMNFTNRYYRSANDLLSSESFAEFIDIFFEYLESHQKHLFNWLQENKKNCNAKNELIGVFKLLCVMDVNQIGHPYIKNLNNLNDVVESAYVFWRKMQRYTMITSEHKKGFAYVNFIEADNNFNNLVLSTYRSVQERIKGSENHVYREMNSGSNGSFLVSNFNWNIPNGYEAIKLIPFINKILLRTPLIISTENNKRKGMFTETDTNPILSFNFNKDEWVCLPLKVGRLLTFFYFNFKHISNALALANLFKVASSDECKNQKPDTIVFFGVEDEKNETTFYVDQENNMVIGKVSDSPEIDYFGYNKKMILTLFNVFNMRNGLLPIHGAMLKIYLKNGQEKNLLFMGDSGTGKSETIEALTKVGKDYLSHYDIIFDDMGYVRINENSQVVGSGSEVGAFIRLDDLDQSVIYSDMDRAIFFNPERVNSRVVVPVSSYETITKEYPVDLFLYANNYVDNSGIKIFENIEEAMPIFIDGKRQAMQTTQEVGISTTFFANPFGPMQLQDLCNPLIKQNFEQLFKTKVQVGEIYTCLGLEHQSKNTIETSAKALLDIISNN